MLNLKVTFILPFPFLSGTLFPVKYFIAFAPVADHLKGNTFDHRNPISRRCLNQRLQLLLSDRS